MKDNLISIEALAKRKEKGIGMNIERQMKTVNAAIENSPWLMADAKINEDTGQIDLLRENGEVPFSDICKVYGRHGDIKNNKPQKTGAGDED